MPWQGASIVDQRRAFITEYLAGVETVTALAAAYGISRKAAYYWIAQFKAGGLPRLAGRSTRPLHSPKATAPDVVAAILAARARHPTWGAQKLRSWLQRRQPETAWPCRATLHTVLVRQGQVRRRRPRRGGGRSAHRLTVPTAPNVVWTVDFKGQFRTGDGVLCYPLTLRDAWSRCVLRCHALRSVRTTDTLPQLRQAFATYGLPECLRSDNGAPFAGPGLAGLSQLAVWLIRLGIRPERIAPGCPGQNGAHEQFHRVLKAETARPPAASLTAQQRRFQRFVVDYNTERPHAALDDAPPATRYQPSSRPWPERLPPVDYALTAEVRRVRASGDIKWRGRSLFLSHVLAGHDVGFEPLADDGRWLVRFAAVPLAIFDERHWRLQTAE